MLRDVLEGIPGTGVRAGVLGEIGTTEPLSPTERTVLEATGRVQAQTGTAIVMHPDSVHRTYEQIARALDILERAGADLDRVIISHCDDRLHPNYDSYAKLAARGCTLAFDTFGKQTYYATRRRQYPSDDQRIATIARLVGDGLAGSVTLAHDVCYKTDLTRWGGDGYGHVPRNIVPRLRQAGVSDAAIQQMLVENPRRLLPLDASEVDFEAECVVGLERFAVAELRTVTPTLSCGEGASDLSPPLRAERVGARPREYRRADDIAADVRAAQRG